MRALKGEGTFDKQEYHLRRTYGISREQYEQMVADQKGKCAICRKFDNKLHVDHCHTTGQIRGLLCGSCNRGLGLFRDDPAIMRRAITYAQR